MSLLSATNYKTEYQNQVHANIQLKNTIISDRNKIKDLENELKITKVREQERMLLYIPFTTWGISKHHATGFLVGYILAKIWNLPNEW